jgi:hypothetical protein
VEDQNHLRTQNVLTQTARNQQQLEDIMWEKFKNALVGVKEALGIQIPGLPVDLGSLGETATTAIQDATESATAVVDEAAVGVVDGSTAISDAITELPLGGTQPK